MLAAAHVVSSNPVIATTLSRAGLSNVAIDGMTKYAG